jgi:hypothetical protein
MESGNILAEKGNGVLQIIKNAECPQDILLLISIIQ